MRNDEIRESQWVTKFRDPNAVSDTELNKLSENFLKIINRCVDTFGDVKELVESQCEKSGQILIWNTKKDTENIPRQVLAKYYKITEATEKFRPEYLKKFKNPGNNFKLFLVFSRKVKVSELTSDEIRFKVEMDAYNKPPEVLIPDDVIDLYYIDVDGENFTTFDKLKLATFLACFESNSSVRDLLKEHLVSF